MPARRELHTGRYNFLHRSWGPLEPFDDSAIELLSEAGVYTHLVTDHQHYWEDGGGTYHPRFSSFELIRGQEGVPWKGEVNDEGMQEELQKLQPHAQKLGRHDQINRSMCDHYLGQVLDTMDQLRLWDDTLLIVNTDHGFLLGEHDQWAKCVQAFYNEVAHTPLFIWDPRSRVQGEYRHSLVQTIDLPATLLNFFGLTLPKDMQGKPLSETIASNKSVREAALFGLHGGHVNVTDGMYVETRHLLFPFAGPF